MNQQTDPLIEESRKLIQESQTLRRLSESIRRESARARGGLMGSVDPITPPPRWKPLNIGIDLVE